jgi:hypothetical protein
VETITNIFAVINNIAVRRDTVLGPRKALIISGIPATKEAMLPIIIEVDESPKNRKKLQTSTKNKTRVSLLFQLNCFLNKTIRDIRVVPRVYTIAIE